ncbi:MAG TPA: hypothetical protein VIK20_01120 [Bacteroidales bacterium]
MKKSSIIAIAWGIFVVGGLLTYLIDQRIYEDKKIKPNALMKDIELPPFSVIVAERNSDLHVEQSNSNKLSIEYYKGSMIPSNLYAVKGDTLYVYSGLRLFLKCKNVNTIIGRKHFWMGITNVAPKDLKIDMSDGDFYYYNTDSIAKRVTNLSVLARDSAYLEINDRFVENIKINSDSAVVQIVTTSNNITAKLKHKASLNFNNSFQNLTVEKDKTSYYGIGRNY